jgi:streptomycin 6-kinase
VLGRGEGGLAKGDLPAEVLGYAARGPAWATWVEDLPRIAGDIMIEWELTTDGPSWHGHCALVLPVARDDSTPAVLKLSWMHEEQEFEHLALQAWQGNSTVRLYRADPRRGALLLERLNGNRSLLDIDAHEACEITADFYPRLHVPALPQLRTLSSYVERWTGNLTRLDLDAPIPRRLVEQAVSLGAAFGSDPATNGRMIHGDLHYANVLAAEREPWLVIDPKPMSGDPHYEVAPLLWNRWDELVAAGNLRAGIRRRFHTVVDAAGLDEERARAWVIVRMVHNALWAIEDASGGLTDEDRDYLTMCITVAKAMDA